MNKKLILDINKIKEYADQGLTKVEIAKAYGECSYSHLSRWIKEYASIELNQQIERNGIKRKIIAKNKMKIQRDVE